MITIMQSLKLEASNKLLECCFKDDVKDGIENNFSLLNLCVIRKPNYNRTNIKSINKYSIF